MSKIENKLQKAYKKYFFNFNLESKMIQLTMEIIEKSY